MDQATCAPSDQRRHLRTARPAAQLVQGRRDWFRITNLGDSTAELLVYDEIGYFGVSAADLIGQLSALNVKDLSVRLSSPGGDVFDGIAIMNALRSHPARVTVQVDALAASIASVIAMAGDEIIMAPHSEMMIHEASGVAIGDAATMREMADLLDRQSDKIAGIYAERAGGQRPSWRKRMRNETWYTAEEAVTAGLADRVADLKRRPSCEDMPDEPEEQEERGDMPMAASWDLSIFRYAGRGQAPDPLNEAHLVGEHGPETVTLTAAAVPAMANNAADVQQPAEPEPEPDGQEQPAEPAADSTEPDTTAAEAGAVQDLGEVATEPEPAAAELPADASAEPAAGEPATQEPAAQADAPEPPADPVPAVPADWAAATAHLDRRDEWGDLVASLTSDNAVFARLRENLL